MRMQGLAKGVAYLAFDGCIQCDQLASDILRMVRSALADSGTRLIVVQPGNTRWDAVLEVTNRFPTLIYGGKAYHHVAGLLDALGGGEK